ncbi:ThuA domain-containing protein [Aegicerativicinus sediminis]|uniref:ThuA domain-containing protein n=1 Tax=Aegicerativicinus sediminis TaxID=2893202 RepID=UPI001E520CB0|nr:ThuA domain-containing protein [Aegicerativicinus sediminis]
MKSRRHFLGKSLLIGAGLLTSRLWANTKHISFGSSPLPELRGKKVVFLYGGWEGHEPEKFRDYLVPWMKEEGASVEVFDTLEPYTNESLMKSVDLVVQIFTMSSITPEQEKGLLQAIKKGVGFAGWHGGMCDAFRNNPEYQFMTGGQWVSHPGGVIDYSVQIVDHTDNVTTGLKDFKMKSEQYYMHIDPNVKVLATTTFNNEHAFWIDGCTIPVAWKKMYGNGRVFFTSLGHNLDHITTVPEAIEILKRGIHWAGASKYLPKEEWIDAVYKPII